MKLEKIEEIKAYKVRTSTGEMFIRIGKNNWLRYVGGNLMNTTGYEEDFLKHKFTKGELYVYKLKQDTDSNNVVMEVYDGFSSFSVKRYLINKETGKKRMTHTIIITHSEIIVLTKREKRVIPSIRGVWFSQYLTGNVRDITF